MKLNLKLCTYVEVDGYSPLRLFLVGIPVLLVLLVLVLLSEKSYGDGDGNDWRR